MFQFLVTAMLLTLAGTFGRQAGTVPTTQDTAIVANERALLDAASKSDAPAFVSLVLPEGVWATRQGFIPMNLLAGGLDAFKITRWEIVNPHVTWLDDNCAIVLYAWQGAGTFQGQALPPTAIASTVWSKRNGKWLAAHHQETELTK
jgi:hypothetical protein